MHHARTQRYWEAAFGSHNPSGAKFPKFHAHTHFPEFIPEYGAPALTYGGWWEQAHIGLVKVPYLRTGRRVQDLYRLLMLRIALFEAIRQKMKIASDADDDADVATIVKALKKRKRLSVNQGEEMSMEELFDVVRMEQESNAMPLSKHDNHGYLHAANG